MVDLGVPTANFGKPLDSRIDKCGRLIPEPPAPWYPNVAFSKFDGVGALKIYRQVIAKETPEERKRNGYQVRSAMNIPTNPNHPHLTDPARERGPPTVDGGADVRQWGFDLNSADGKFLRKCIDDNRGRRGPQDRLPYTESSQQVLGWTQAKPLGAYCSRSVPALQETDITQYEWLRPTLRDNAKRKQRKREQKAAAAEASVEQAVKRCLSYTYHGDTAKKWSKPVGETDATSFQKQFIIATGVPMHKCDPKPGLPVILKKLRSQGYCDQWLP
jgi:hypothetical protein